MSSTQNAEWDADLPDDLRTTADSLQASLDAFEQDLTGRIHLKRIQPLKDQLGGLEEDLDDVTDRLTAVEGEVWEGRGGQESLAARLGALDISLATRSRELETALDEGLDAAKRSREEAARDAEAARRSLRSALKESIDKLWQETEERASGIDQRLTEERQRTGVLDERLGTIAENLQADRRKATEAAAETKRRFDAEETARSELRESLTQALGSRVGEVGRRVSDMDKARREDADAIRGDLGKLQERLERLQGQASQRQANVDARFEELGDTREHEREEYLQAIVELREQLAEVSRIRASDFEGVENKLAEAAAARLELSSRLARSQKMALLLGAIALVLSIVALALAAI